MQPNLNGWTQTNTHSNFRAIASTRNFSMRSTHTVRKCRREYCGAWQTGREGRESAKQSVKQTALSVYISTESTTGSTGNNYWNVDLQRDTDCQLANGPAVRSTEKTNRNPNEIQAESKQNPSGIQMKSKWNPSEIQKESKIHYGCKSSDAKRLTTGDTNKAGDRYLFF